MPAPSKTHEPLVTIGNQSINAIFSHIQGEDTQALNRVDEKYRTPFMCHISDGSQSASATIGVTDPTDAHDAVRSS